MAIITKIWSAVYGDKITTTWLSSCGQAPVVERLWNSICGSAPVRGKRWNASYQQSRVVQKKWMSVYQSAGAVSRIWIARYREQGGIVGKIWNAVYESRNTWPVAKQWVASYISAVTGSVQETQSIAVTCGGVALQSMVGLSGGRSEENYPWECTITLTDIWEAQLLDQFENVVLNRYGTEYSLVVVDRGQQEQVGDGYSVVWTIKLVSPTYKLSGAYAVPVTKTWPSGYFCSVIVQELCDAAGVVMDWQAPDIIIGEVVAEKQSPIQIIRTVIVVFGGLAETTFGGTLRIRKEYDRLPLTGVSPDYTITGLEINSVQKSPVDPFLLVNYVVVSDEDDATEAATGGLQHEEEQRSDGGVDIRAWAEPWGIVSLVANASALEVSLLQGGIKEQEIEEWLIFENGESAATKPIYADFVVIEYRGENPGSISWGFDSKKLIASNGKYYYCLVKYTWRFYSFTYYSINGNDYQLIQEG